MEFYLQCGSANLSIVFHQSYNYVQLLRINAAELGKHQKENFRIQQRESRDREKARRDDERHMLEMKKLELEIARLAAVEMETIDIGKTSSVLFGELPSLPSTSSLECSENPEEVKIQLLL